jgi:predicted acetyltransferase
MRGVPSPIAPCASLNREFLVLEGDYQRAGEREWCDPAKGALINFPDYVRTLEREAKGEGVSADWAPTSHFWLLSGSQLIGTARIRHNLTPAVEERAGHIGYDIAPEFRGRGYGHQILALVLSQARKLGVQDILAICDEINIPSQRVLERASGVITKTRNGEMWYILTEGSCHQNRPLL